MPTVRFKGVVGAPSDGGHSQGGVFVGTVRHQTSFSVVDGNEHHHQPASSSSIIPFRAYITKPTTLRLRPLLRETW